MQFIFSFIYAFHFFYQCFIIYRSHTYFVRFMSKYFISHGCSSKAHLLLLTLDKGYLLTAAPPDLERGAVPLGPPAPAQPPLHGCGGLPWVPLLILAE